MQRRPTPPMDVTNASMVDPPAVSPASGPAATTSVPPETTGPPAPVSQSRPPLFGFNDQSIGYSLATPAQDAELSRRGGATVARVTFDWRWAEPNPGQWDLARYDALYRELTARGIRPVWVLLFAPHWAWDDSVRCDQWHEDCTYPPARTHDADWKAMVETVVRRYPQSAAIEVWNEPNLHWFWQPKADPVRYTELLVEAHDVVKAVDPQMPVLGGSVLDLPVTNETEVSLADFVGTIYAQGGGPAMDGIAVHLYPHAYEDWVRSGLDHIRAVRDSAGDATKSIWVTEVGASTTDPQPLLSVSDQGQADVLTNAYRRMAAMPDVRAVIVHTLIEPARGGAERGYGLVRPDLTPKPAYCALAAAVGAADACSP